METLVEDIVGRVRTSLSISGEKKEEVEAVRAEVLALVRSGNVIEVSIATLGPNYLSTILAKTYVQPR